MKSALSPSDRNRPLGSAKQLKSAYTKLRYPALCRAGLDALRTKGKVHCTSLLDTNVYLTLSFLCQSKRCETGNEKCRQHLWNHLRKICAIHNSISTRDFRGAAKPVASRRARCFVTR